MKSYNFIYRDKQYMTYDLSDDDHAKLMRALERDTPPAFVTLSCGAICTHDLRFVKEYVEEAPEETLAATPTEYELDKYIYEQSHRREEDIDDDGEPV